MTRSFLFSSVALGFTLIPAFAEVPRVATDIPVVQSLTAMVMGSLGQPVVLMDAGADAHDYQLRPSQAAALEEADLLVWVGPEMTPWLERPAAARAKGSTLALLADPGTQRRFYETAEGETAAEHEAEGHADHEGQADAHAGHDHQGTDPHAWLDPTNAVIWVDAIANALAARDPENADTYRANAATAKKTLAALDADLSARLAPAKGKPLILGHDAYGYLAEHYGLTVAGTIATGDATSPGAARLAALNALVAKSGAACFLPDVGQSDNIVQVLTKDSPLRVGRALDPEGRAQAPGAALYPALMTEIAGAIADCVTAP